jgi:DNA-binding HxlR family transcriptional regulator/putative sterol carrier protein
VTSRRYEDPCGIARALDRVGERWALLIVRELLLGPKRFVDLHRALTGISPNVLAQRLKELDAAGVVCHRTVGPPIGAQVYELTDWGLELEPVLLSLARWGSRAPIAAPGPMSVDALVISLRTTFDPRAAGALEVSVKLELDSDRFVFRVSGGTFEIARGWNDASDVEVVAESDTFRSVVYGGLALDDAIADGRLTVVGKRSVARRLVRCFTRPAQHPDAVA